MIFENYERTKTKRHAIGAELIIIFCLCFLIIMAFTPQIAEFIRTTNCNIPYPPPTQDETLSFTSAINKICQSNADAKIITNVFLAYTFLCALMIASPLKATPTTWYQGLYLKQRNGKPANFINALRFIYLGSFFPIMIIIMYYAYYDFTLQIHKAAFATALFGLLTSASALFQALHRDKNFVLNEYVSNLQIHLTQKAEEKFKKKIQKKQKRWIYRIEHKLSKYPLGLFLALCFFAFITLNILREGQAPKGYNEYLYAQRTVPQDNNGYFALAGMDAPENIANTYKFGQEKANIAATNYQILKQALGLNTPHIKAEDINYKTFPEYTSLEWDGTETQNFDCFYSHLKETHENCATENDITTTINANKTLWSRFERLPNYAHFDAPDILIPHDLFYGQTLISLAKTKAAQIILLQKQDHSDRAVSEWTRFMNLYINLIKRKSGIVDKAIFMILINIHGDTLETLLLNDPTLARSHGKSIDNLLSGINIKSYGMNTMYRDDYAMIEPMLTTITGALPAHQKRILSCLKKIEADINLPASEFIKTSLLNFCEQEFPNNSKTMMLKAVTDAGDPITNIIYGLLMPGVLKGKGIVKNIHYRDNQFKMARLAIKILQQNLKSEQIQDFLNSQSADLQNSITEKPFIWDNKKYRIVIKNPFDDYPNKFFQVNITP